MKCPCTRECPGRTETCHSECEEYLAYAKYCDGRRKNRLKEKDINNYIQDAIKASGKGKK